MVVDSRLTCTQVGDPAAQHCAGLRTWRQRRRHPQLSLNKTCVLMTGVVGEVSSSSEFVILFSEAEFEVPWLCILTAPVKVRINSSYLCGNT